VNVPVCGFTVDALWRAERVIVELDGDAAHGTSAQTARAHQRDLALRAAGFSVLRYSWWQVTKSPAAVAADVRRTLKMRGHPASRRG
jgi:very-short-patch-repair endonuclease